MRKHAHFCQPIQLGDLVQVSISAARFSFAVTQQLVRVENFLSKEGRMD